MCVLLVDSLHKLADDQWHTLNPLDLLLSANELPLQAALLILDVLLLQLDVLELALQLLERRVLISRICADALEVFDARYRGRRGLLCR